MEFLQKNIEELKTLQKTADGALKVLENEFSRALPIVMEENPEIAEEVLRLKNEMQKPENIGKNSEFLNKFESILKDLKNAG